MTIKELKKGIKGVFKQPITEYYLGRIKYHTPYFEPRGFNKNIISVRRLKPYTKNNVDNFLMKRGYGINKKEWENLPIVRRSKDWIIKIFNSYYWVQIGRPWATVKSGLGWKDKYNSPRYEWNPFFQIWFFNWQFCINWVAPDVGQECKVQDHYWEQVLWFLYYSDKNVDKARDTWGWQTTNKETGEKESTWDDNYLV